MSRLHRLENIAVRVMYFFNVTDTFLPFSVLGYWICVRSGMISGLSAFSGAQPLMPFVFWFCFFWFCFAIAEFHVLFLCSLPIVILAVFPEMGAMQALFVLGFFVVLTSLIQVVFMGFPMGLASRSPMVPLRMYLNSFAILAPTTMSLPVTLGFQVYMAFSLQGVLFAPWPWGAFRFAGALLMCALLTRRFRKKGFVPLVYQPVANGKKVNRVVLLNIDGLSYHAFRKANAPFLHQLEKDFLHAKGGASTVYKAFTNPAFASILTGVAPAVHGVVDNNFGQTIKCQALPDIIPARLYGSMHVKHFSKPEWNVSLTSLVSEGHGCADARLFETFKADLKAYPETELWLMDLSMADYCGHAWGAYSKAYYRAIGALDAQIKAFFEWCHLNGKLEDTLFIIGSDHGMFIGEHAYLLSPKEEFVPFIMVNKETAAQALEERVSIMDIAANVSYVLARPYCARSRGRVFDAYLFRENGCSLAERLGFNGKTR